MIAELTRWLSDGVIFGIGFGLGAWVWRSQGVVAREQRAHNERLAEMLERKTDAVETIAAILQAKWDSDIEDRKGGGK